MTTETMKTVAIIVLVVAIIGLLLEMERLIHMAKMSERKRIGKLVREEGGKSQIKQGDAMTFKNQLKDEFMRDPSYLIEFIHSAFERARKSKAAKQKQRRR